jgi:hypothetical protein
MRQAGSLRSVFLAIVASADVALGALAAAVPALTFGAPLNSEVMAMTLR